MDGEILRLFADLPLQGPGSEADTIAVLELVRSHNPTTAAVVDFGCGTGRSSLILLGELPAAAVSAIDSVPLFIERLADEATRRGYGNRLTAVVGDMLAPNIEAGTIDLIWSEGAAYAVGFETTLRAWKPLLKDDGYCVLSECEWFSNERPPDVAAFWAQTYPDMGDRTENIRRAGAAGFDVLATHILSEEGWIDYYAALTNALELADKATLATAFTDGITQEIEVKEKSDGSYGYSFYVLQPRHP